MRDALKELKCRREKIGVSWQAMAEQTQRDARTAMRQLDDTANPTLETLEQYAQALGGGIHFVPNDWKISSAGAERDQETITAQAEEIGRLKAENAALSQRIERQNIILEQRLRRIDELQALLANVMNKLLERV